MTKYNIFRIVFVLIATQLIVTGILFLPGAVMEIFAWTGLQEEMAYKLTEVCIGVVLLGLSSNRFYSAIRTICNNRIRRAESHQVKLLLSIKVLNDLVAAFPKRTLIFGIYLFLIMAQYFGMIKDVYNLGFIAIFIISVDKILNAWKAEKGEYTSHLEKAYRRTMRIKHNNGRINYEEQ